MINDYGVQFVVTKMGLFLIYSDYLFAENILTSTRCKRDKRKSRVKWQPAFRLVKVVFVVVNRQHRVHNQTVVPVVSVVVKREGG